ncbi:Non-histone chromosomal protein 6 [Smittium culicis]|uniref:Non-histone chromosomal protein 6 n=1 Tax=Smittium culicis TaxID=133412 RepID=A0A1R1YC40_9FUNG|nr:Non-histone chromosomal protein 6 [Smittium culicis]
MFTNASKNQTEVPEPTKKVVKDPNAPKRPLSPYILFCNEKRESVKILNPNQTSQMISKMLGDIWNSMSSLEKKRYDDMFQQQKLEYNQKVLDYEKQKTDLASIKDEHDMSQFDLANCIMSGVINHHSNLR